MENQNRKSLKKMIDEIEKDTASISVLDKSDVKKTMGEYNKIKKNILDAELYWKELNEKISQMNDLGSDESSSDECISDELYNKYMIELGEITNKMKITDDVDENIKYYLRAESLVKECNKFLSNLAMKTVYVD